MACSTSYYHLKLLGILENSTGKRIALPVWKFILPVMLKIGENTDTISCKQVMRIKKSINYGITTWSDTKSSKLT